MQTRFLVVGVVLLWMTSVCSADAIFKPSYSLTNNNANDVNIGLTYVTLTVSDAGSDARGKLVDFTFRNTSPQNHWTNKGIVTDIWFDDGTYTDGILADVSDSDPFNPQLITSAGVSFTRWANPSNPPGAATLEPGFDVTFSTDPSKPQPHNGLNSIDDFLTVRWLLRDGYTYSDAVHAVAGGELRIAFKMQGLGKKGEGSETFIFVPLPAAGWAGLVMLGGLASAGVRRRWRIA